MSNLPHPLGDTNPGEMFYPGSPTVTVADVAGAGGSRATEFGEDGLSSAVNRGLYALAKNEEYIQARMEAKIAKPEFTSFVPAGGNGDVYAFVTVDVWVGDATYLPETQAIRDSLISVLDAKYNDLLDTAGNRVVVREFRNAGDTSSIVGDTGGAGGDDDGFYNVGGGALIKFKTVHPVTGADVTNPYTIPDATGVVFAHGIAGQWDTLATGGSEHLMRDALVKGSIRSAHEIHGAVFLTDGSRSMRGALDMVSYNLNNVVAIVGAPAAPMSIISDDDFFLKDAHLSAPLALSEASVASLFVGGSAPWSSIVGALNSKSRTSSKLHGNRAFDKIGVLIYTGGTGLVTYPDLNMIIDGEHVIVPAGNFTAANGSLEMMVITGTGTVAQRAAGAGVSGDIPVSWHEWNGAAFTTSLDIRWPMDGRSATFDITVGSNTDGADFDTLQEAVDFCTAAQAIGNIAIPMRILIVGNTTIGEQIEITTPLKIEGRCDAGAAFPSITVAGFIGEHAVDCNGQKVEIKDVQFTWGHSADQSSGYGAIFDPGAGSRITGCTFSGAGFNWANGILAGSSDRALMHFQDCYFLDVTEIGIDGAAKFNTTTIHKCRHTSTGVTGTHSFRMQSTNNVITDCLIDAGASVDGIVIGVGGSIIRNKLTGDTTGIGITLDEATLTGTWSWTVGDNRVSTYLRCLDVNTVAVIEAHPLIEGNYFGICDIGVQLNCNSSLDSFSDFIIENNVFDQCAVSGFNIAIASYCGSVSLTSNQFRSQAGTAIWMRGNAIDVCVERNTVIGFGALVGDSALKVNMDGQFGEVQVLDNSFQTALGQSTSSDIVQLLTDFVYLRGNKIGSAGTRMTGIVGIELSGIRVHGNNFNNTVNACVLSSLTAQRGAEVDDNTFDDWTAQAVVVTGGRGVKIVANTFRDAAGVGVDVSGDGTHIVSGCNVSTNTFDTVNGEGTGYSTIIGTSVGSILGLNVIGNNFYSCGDDVTGGQNVYCIRTLVRAQIKGNYIHQMRGPDGTPTEFTIAIAAEAAGSLVEANTFIQDISAGVVEELVGIQADADEVQIVSNRISITGTIATMTSIRAIWCANLADAANHHHMVSNNYIDEWTGTGAVNLLIKAAGNYIIATGNYAYCPVNNGYDMDFSGGTGGMIGPNRIVGAASTLNTGTNGPADTGVIKTDLNVAS